MTFSNTSTLLNSFQSKMVWNICSLSSTFSCLLGSLFSNMVSELIFCPGTFAFHQCCFYFLENYAPCFVLVTFSCTISINWMRKNWINKEGVIWGHQLQNYADNPTIPFGFRTNEDHDQGIVNLAYVELEQQNSVLLAWLHFHLLIHFFPVLLGVFILDCWVYSFLTSLGGDP